MKIRHIPLEPRSAPVEPSPLLPSARKEKEKKVIEEEDNYIYIQESASLSALSTLYVREIGDRWTYAALATNLNGETREPLR